MDSSSWPNSWPKIVWTSKVDAAPASGLLQDQWQVAEFGGVHVEAALGDEVIW
jgi:hypothetical protein